MIQSLLPALVLASLVVQSLPAQTQPASAAPRAAAKFGPKWNVLIGEWIGVEAGDGGSGRCAFRFDLDKHVLIRTNHAQLPPSAGRPGGAHNDLMVIRPGSGEDDAAAMYWDNEGHVIEYSAAWDAEGSTLTFLSKAGPGPQFRLVYRKLDPNRLTVSFDMAPPGQPGAFKPYTSGRLKRASGTAR